MSPFIPHRADEDRRPEHAVILAAVANFRIAVRAAFERCLDLSALQRRRPAPSKVEALAEHLLSRVSGQSRKLSFAKMIGLPGSFASVNTTPSASSQPRRRRARSFRKPSTSDSAAFCTPDLVSSIGMMAGASICKWAGSVAKSVS